MLREDTKALTTELRQLQHQSDKLTVAANRVTQEYKDAFKEGKALAMEHISQMQEAHETRLQGAISESWIQNQENCSAVG